MHIGSLGADAGHDSMVGSLGCLWLVLEVAQVPPRLVRFCGFAARSLAGHVSFGGVCRRRRGFSRVAQVDSTVSPFARVGLGQGVDHRAPHVARGSALPVVRWSWRGHLAAPCPVSRRSLDCCTADRGCAAPRPRGAYPLRLTGACWIAFVRPAIVPTRPSRSMQLSGRTMRRAMTTPLPPAAVARYRERRRTHTRLPSHWSVGSRVRN